MIAHRDNPPFKSSKPCPKLENGKRVYPRLADQNVKWRAHARALHNQGRNEYQIAAKLRISVALVRAYLTYDPPRTPTPAEIRKQDRKAADLILANSLIEPVALRHNITLEAIKGPSRTADINAARFDAYAAVSAALPGWSIARIADVFERDHTTILSAFKKRGIKHGHFIPRPRPSNDQGRAAHVQS